ncbi:hypothetical protein ANCCAN_08588 [Ancylostoma caninum]|uniref:Uncharacterized protein n=1 Tax=Ancylostoma caninum TaxID=29170 RepID=A0A368GR03_ANCCA|nr:hypothetical protein ANCCAN_08588 [Ancylostoma caninum]
MRMYYTTASAIRDREELVCLKLADCPKRTLASLANGRSTLTFVVTKPGLHIFKDE